MSDTPRTDQKSYGGDWEAVVSADFARTLERELQAERAKRENAVTAAENWASQYKAACARADAAEAKVAEWQRIAEHALTGFNHGKAKVAELVDEIKRHEAGVMEIVRKLSLPRKTPMTTREGTTSAWEKPTGTCSRCPQVSLSLQDAALDAAKKTP